MLKDIQHKNKGSNTEWLETLERKKPNCMTNSNYFNKPFTSFKYS